MNGRLVCGDVVESVEYARWLRDVGRKVLAVETEAGPIFDLCKRQNVHAASVRGISDYANPGKGQLETKTDGRIRGVAARSAATFLHMQLQNDLVLRFLGNVSARPEPVGQCVSVNAPSLPTTLDEIESEIDRRLRSLSPQYKLKQRGYKLPFPRLKPSMTPGSTPREAPSTIEALEAIAAHRQILIRVPRTYPDPSLAWALARSLLTADVAGKKIIPVVISGKSIAPPGSGLDSLSPIRLDRDIGASGGEYLFIAEWAPVASKTRVAKLLADVRSWDQARFVFLVKDDQNFVDEAGFERATGAEKFSLCDISFAEMTTFLEKSFDMAPIEAEVVALRLRTTFRKFSISPHPSFFAGIPEDTLSALLTANRRAELIQLAVDGFLTFIVAGDAEPVRLSRTKRAEFLRKLAVQMAVERMKFSLPQLVALAQEFSDEYDYGLNTAGFVDAFISKGILRVEDGFVEITLPFIQAYLLAFELARSPALAEKYFDFQDPELGLLTFDLYAELGPSPELIQRGKKALEAANKKAQDLRADHVLLSGRVYPSVMRNPSRIQGLNARIQDARKAVASGESEMREKMAVLDLADRVNEAVAIESESVERERPVSTKMAGVLEEVHRPWLLMTILLGSGAENIRGEERQQMASLVIEGAENVLHYWIEEARRIDFAEIKARIMADDDMRLRASGLKDTDFEHLVNALLDFIEFMIFSGPLERVLTTIFEQAHHGIIGHSLEKTRPLTPLGDLIRALWLADIGVGAGRPALSAAIGGLGDAAFLRVNLTSFLIMRVKWMISVKPVRVLLLDAAESLVKPMNRDIGKGELLRFIDSHLPGDALAVEGPVS